MLGPAPYKYTVIDVDERVVMAMRKPAVHEIILLLGLAALAAFLMQRDIARAQQSAKPQVFTEFRSKLALDGYDPVAYFKSGRPQKGTSAHALSWNGATWHFASPENKTAFEVEPKGFRAAIRRLLRLGGF